MQWSTVPSPQPRLPCELGCDPRMQFIQVGGKAKWRGALASLSLLGLGATTEQLHQKHTSRRMQLCRKGECAHSSPPEALSAHMWYQKYPEISTHPENGSRLYLMVQGGELTRGSLHGTTGAPAGLGGQVGGTACLKNGSGTKSARGQSSPTEPRDYRPGVHQLPTSAVEQQGKQSPVITVITGASVQRREDQGSREVGLRRLLPTPTRSAGSLLPIYSNHLRKGRERNLRL